MKISEEEIRKKKQQLGLEKSVPADPASSAADALKEEMQKDAEESDRAEQAEKLRTDQSAGTNNHNQYRYGGRRP